ELAIPWTELGLSGPPSPGQTWGFNVVSRDRDSLTAPADKFVSLSPLVQGGDDVQNPSKWTKLQFVDTIASMNSTTDIVYCPRVKTQYPVIDGVIRSGEWYRPDGFSFGASAITAAAPSQTDEPNITLSPFSAEATAAPASGTASPTTPKPSTPGYDILLPGGGTIHVGKMPNPTPTQSPTPTITPYGPTEAYTPPKKGKGKGKKGSTTQEAQVPTGETGANPLTPKGSGPMVKPLGPNIDTTVALGLSPETRVTKLLVAPFFMDYTFKLDAGMTPVWLDQPMDGRGVWSGGLQVGWDVNQVRDARRGGVDVLLPVYDPADPNANAELDTLVEAIKEIRATGDDYPLLGLRTGSATDDVLIQFFNHVPDDLLAKIALPDDQDNKPAAIVVTDAVPPGAVPTAEGFVSEAGGHRLLEATPDGFSNLKIALVSPGGRGADEKITGRNLAQTYQTAWQTAVSNDPDWVYLNSWNDYKNGTEVAASRQYGEQYADLTKVLSLGWSGQSEWHAKYLSNTCPAEIAPETLYTVTVRLENSGSLPWRVGEGYSLCYRWYKDGRLYDDSAPRIPLTQDIYPGQCATVGVGVLAQNSYGGAIEPGDYVLVFDVIQGQDRWFSYAGDTPLKVHVKVLSGSDAVPAYKIRVLATSTQSFMQVGGTYDSTVILRNEGSQPWKAGTSVVAEDLERVSDGPSADIPVGKAALAQDIPPGSIAYVSVPVKAGGSAGGHVTLAWAVQPQGAAKAAATDSDHTDNISLVSRDAGVSFALSDLPRHLRTGDKASAKLGLVNVGPETWSSAYKVGYHWAYLDGTPASEGAELTPVTPAVAPGRGGTVTATFHAPDYPGRYNLVWDMMLPDGKWASETSASHAASLLVAQVWVTGDKDSKAVPVDLTKSFNTNGIGFESAPADANLDGQGHSIPGEMFPPDGTAEANANPILVGQPGPNLYPSGYYCSAYDSGRNHRISFLYPSKHGNDIVSCQGQSIDLPDGKYRVLHILGAVAGQSPATSGVAIPKSSSVDFDPVYAEGTATSSVPMAGWQSYVLDNDTNTAPPPGTVGFVSPYRLDANGIDASAPCVFCDYSIKLDPNKRLQDLRLPNDPSVKIVAITLEK
ncbi:MAG TPA: hypothetical protein VFW40_13260, partial [Capsulimonadaceae bacterium]|nr:hypothetical protein [Capsulimonadaceae bacterium]